MPEAELYDPVGQVFSNTASMTVPRAGQAAVVLPDGRVLILGGNSVGSDPVASTEFFAP